MSDPEDTTNPEQPPESAEQPTEENENEKAPEQEPNETANDEQVESDAAANTTGNEQTAEEENREPNEAEVNASTEVVDNSEETAPAPSGVTEGDSESQQVVETPADESQAAKEEADVDHAGGDQTEPAEDPSSEDVVRTAEEEEGAGTQQEEGGATEENGADDQNGDDKDPGIQDQQQEDTPQTEEPTEPGEPLDACPPESVRDNTSVGVEVSAQQNTETAPLAKANVSVKLVLVTNETTTTAFPLDRPMGELRNFLSSAMKIPEEFLELQYSGQVLDNEITLAQLGAQPAGTIELNLYSTNQSYETKPLQSKSDYVMPDVINVTVKDIDDQVKTINVEIERFGAQKPYLGGFRNKQSGVEFMNASSQTHTKLRPWDGKTRFCRDAQTVEEKRLPQQTNYNTSTQMTGIGMFVSNMSDRLVTPGKYETASEFLGKREDATVVIQSYFRRWASRNFVEDLRRDRDSRLEWERQEEEGKAQEKEERVKKEFDRRMNPKCKEDFDLLFHALEKWRLEETAEINSSLSGAARKAALSMLLEQETKLIAAINRHKNDSDVVNREKTIRAFLDKASAPKKWRGPDGKMTEMDTPYTLRALQLKDIYNSINMKYLTQDERLDILLTLKHTLKEHDCKLSQDIVELIDREADLLMRGVKEDNLEGLRKRISTLFLQYCKTPAFNPEAARLIKVPQDPSTLRKGVYHCPSCGLYLPSTEFPLSSNSASPGKCRNCRKVDNDARTRQDYSHYVYMLRQLRLSEEKMADGSRIALLLQEQDLQYLVENIWGGQSALSQWDDLYDLVLVRWSKYHEWSPWNCILLTKDEATAHDRIDNLEQAYRDVFLNRIRQKHSLARNYFSRLSGMAEKIRTIQPTKEKRVLPEDQTVQRKQLTELFAAS